MPDCHDIKHLRLNDLVKFKNDEDRMERDGDGTYIVIGLQSGVVLETGWSQEKRLTLLCNNGVVEASPNAVELVLHPFSVMGPCASVG